MAPRPASRYQYPITLLELRNLDDHENVTCIGRPYPTVGRCTASLDPEDKLFGLAVQKLQSLSKSKLCVLDGLDEGFLRTLQDIAQGFSCVKPHRHMRGQREQFPYYWIALFILPEFMECMGFNDPCMGFNDPSPGVCFIEKQTMIRSAVDALHLRDLWILSSAMQRLNYNREGLREKRNDAITSCFLMAVTKRLAKGSGKHEEEANELWTRWHNVDEEQRLQWDRLLQKYPQTPLRSTGVKSQFSPQYGSAPHIMQRSGSHDLDVHTPTKSRKRPSAGPLQSVDTSNPEELDSSRKQFGYSRAKRSRRASAPLSIVRHSQISETQHELVPEGKKPTDRGEIGSQSEDKQQDSVNSSNEAVEDTTEGSNYSATSATSPENDLHSRISDRFDIYKKKKPCNIKTTILRVLNFMRKPLNETVDLKIGFIYALRIPGYVKVGYAASEPDDRETLIEKCLNSAELKIENSFNIFRAPNYRRVEMLVQKELLNHRRKLKCKEDKCGGGSGEWFEVDMDTAHKTIQRWTRWMDSGPYDTTRKLTTAEELRIDIYEKDEGFEQLLISRGEDVEPREWNWDAFMRHSNSKIDLLKYSMTRKRPERMTTMSQWMSLQVHWQYNVVLCVAFYFVSTVIRLFADCTSSLFVQAYGPSLFECIVLGGLAALYAA